MRLLLPFCSGIIIQFYADPPRAIIIFAAAAALLLLFAFRCLPLHRRFRHQRLAGILINILLFAAGMSVCRANDITKNPLWFGKNYADSNMLIIRITAPPAEKDRVYKADAEVEQRAGDRNVAACGKLLLYIAKDSGYMPAYGDRMLICGGLQEIKNSGNPGDFDYKSYMRLQQVFHRAYLHYGNYVVLPQRAESGFWHFIFRMRAAVLGVLQQNIRGSKKVTGTAEAMFIGYREDLDRDEVRAYRNAGVVHIIIIAGMHLGLIAGLLAWLFSGIRFLRKLPPARLVLLLTAVWLFTFVTGASVPVLRSAVMLSCIAVGRAFMRKPNTYNSLAASAFLLLCYDPYLLWDAGFQLSYCAVTGIVWLQKPLASLWYTRYALLQKARDICAVSLAAQALILPLCIFYFHSIPLLFLLTNLLCIPIFTLVIFSEIFLVISSGISLLAGATGKTIYVLTGLMNMVIAACNAIPFSLLENIHANLVSTIALYGCIICFARGLINKSPRLLKASALSLFVFVSAWSVDRLMTATQKKLVIYNIPHGTAVDFISGNRFYFSGDSAAESAVQLCRGYMQAGERQQNMPSLNHNGRLWQFYNLSMLVADSAIKWEPLATPLHADILLICSNPKLSIADIVGAVKPAVVVADGSNSVWKIGQWKKECEQLHLRFYNTAEQGAFILAAKN